MFQLRGCGGPDGRDTGYLFIDPFNRHTTICVFAHCGYGVRGCGGIKNSRFSSCFFLRHFFLEKRAGLGCIFIRFRVQGMRID
jgi:hypothetical protein